MILKYYAAFLAAYITLYFFGYSLKVLFLDEDLKKYDLYITPWLGMGLIVMVLFPLSWLGYSVESVIGRFIIAVAVLDALVWLWFREGAFFERREAVFIAAIGVIACTVYAIPIAVNDWIPYAVTQNGDFASYLNCAKAALISDAGYINQLPEGVPSVYTSNFALNNDFRGCVLIQAAFAALYKLDLAHISYMLSAFVMFLNIIVFRLFLGDMKNTPAAVLLIGILPFNTFYQHLVFMAFTGQLYSFGIVTLAFFLECHLARRGKFDPRTCILLVFVLTFNGLNYLEALAFPLIPILSVPLVLFFNKNYDKKHFLQNVIFTGCLFAFLNFPFILGFLRLFFHLDGHPPAWAMYMPTLMDIAGIQGASGNPDVVFALLVVSNLLVSAVIIYQIKKEGAASFLSASCIAYILIHLFFCLRYFGTGEASSYSVFKSALSLSFILIIIMARFLYDKLKRFFEIVTCLFEKDVSAGGLASGSMWKAPCIASVLFALVFLLNVRATVANLKKFPAGPETAITKDHDALKYFAESSAFLMSDFIIDFDAPLPLLSVAYFAPFGRTYALGYGGVFHDSMRSMKASFKDGDIYIASSSGRELQTTDARPLFENGSYRVFQFEEASLLLYDYKGLSHHREKITVTSEDKMARLLTGNEINMIFMVLAGRSVDLLISFYDPKHTSENKLSVRVYANGEFMAESRAESNIVDILLGDIRLNPGKNDISFEFDWDISETSLVGLKIL
jgi:hypothetical protein